MIVRLTKEDLKAPPYNFSDYFIKVHGKAMGRAGGCWLKEMVDPYVVELHRSAARVAIEKKAPKSGTIRQAADQSVAIARSASTEPAKIGDIQMYRRRKSA